MNDYQSQYHIDKPAAPLKQALLFVNLQKPNAQDLAAVISRDLRARGIESRSFAFTGCPAYDKEDAFGLAITLGGDGTVLCAARAMAPQGVPILPLNMGTIGFIASVPPAEWAVTLDRWLAGQIHLSHRLMLEVMLERNGQILSQFSCLNDTVISTSGIAKVIRLHVESESVRMGRYRSDGLIVATATGSTAYSVAAGGPILDPEMEALIINPICPFTLSNRPIVVPATEAVIVDVEAEQRSGVILTLDGQITATLEPNDRVYIRKAPYRAALIASDRTVFYKALRTKLSWSAGPEAEGRHA